MKKILFFLLISVSVNAQISTRCKVCPPSLDGVPDGYVLTDSSGNARWQSVAGFDTSAIGVDSLSNLFWGLNGNAGTTSANFLGTTDGQPLYLRSDSLILDSVGLTTLSIKTKGSALGQWFFGDNYTNTEIDTSNFSGFYTFNDIDVPVFYSRIGVQATELQSGQAMGEFKYSNDKFQIDLQVQDANDTASRTAIIVSPNLLTWGGYETGTSGDKLVLNSLSGENNYRFGDINIATWLEIDSADATVRIHNGHLKDTIGAVSGYVLKSDASGVGTWQPVGEDTTWSPTVTLVGGTGNTTPVYTTNLARYEKIGNIMFCSIELLGDGGAEGAGTGVINIDLPIVAGTSQLHIESPCGRGVNGATEHILFGTISANSTTIALSQQSAANQTTPFQGNDQNNTSRHIDLQFWYRVN